MSTTHEQSACVQLRLKEASEARHEGLLGTPTSLSFVLEKGLLKEMGQLRWP